MCRFVIKKPQTDLLQIVHALSASSGFSGRLDRRQQKCDQDADDRYHDEELDERERTVTPATSRFRPLATNYDEGGLGRGLKKTHQDTSARREKFFVDKQVTRVTIMVRAVGRNFFLVAIGPI